MRIRQSKYSGTWYPDDGVMLGDIIDNCLASAKKIETEDRIYGLIVPHAAYQFSGITAAYAYRMISESRAERIFIFSPDHRGIEDGFTASAADVYRTPLGDVPVDQEVVTALEMKGLVNSVSNDEEHAIEIQLPFLQRTFNTFTIVPLMVGRVDESQKNNLIEFISNYCAKEKDLFIASSDLYHEYSYKRVSDLDKKLIEEIKKFSVEGFEKKVNEPGCTVCGKEPISLVISLASRAGGKRIEILHHTTSGDITGCREEGEYTVGYLSAAIL